MTFAPLFNVNSPQEEKEEKKRAFTLFTDTQPHNTLHWTGETTLGLCCGLGTPHLRTRELKGVTFTKCGWKYLQGPRVFLYHFSMISWESRYS
jgi:hypothetical protein